MCPSRRVAEAPSLFQTTSLNLAAFLLATNRLVLDHVRVQAKFCEFLFVDPGGEGPSIAHAFLIEDPQVGAKAILAARSSLVNEMRNRGGR